MIRFDEPSPPSPTIRPSPRLDCFTLGPYETNCYVVSATGSGSPDSAGPNNTASRECWIVDASFGPKPIIRHIREHGLTPIALVLTHAHIDHIAGANEVVSALSTPTARLPVWIHADERDWLNNPMLNLSAMSGMPVTAPGPDRLLQHNDELTLAGTRWRVLHTPGHSPGGITLHHAESNTAIVGDALFAGSVGRTDFPGSDQQTLFTSIRERLYSLPPTTTVYPGHGPTTTIGREMKYNPFVRG